MKPGTVECAAFGLALALLTTFSTAEASPQEDYILLYENHLETFATALQSDRISSGDKVWILRQHRALRLRAESQLSTRELNGASFAFLASELEQLRGAVESLDKTLFIP